MKIYGNYVGTLETVRNRGVRVREVRLYCNSVVVDLKKKKKIPGGARVSAVLACIIFPDNFRCVFFHHSPSQSSNQKNMA